MKKVLAFLIIFCLSACCGTKTGHHFHAAGFDIPEGQQMRDFFDDFHEPMHARYVGNDKVRWTYYIDYTPDEGDVVRYCELSDYHRKDLCRLNVEFTNKLVTSATSTCQ